MISLLIKMSRCPGLFSAFGAPPPALSRRKGSKRTSCSGERVLLRLPLPGGSAVGGRVAEERGDLTGDVRLAICMRWDVDFA